MNIIDVRIEDHGSVVLFRLLTPHAQAWINSHIDAGRLGNALAVAPHDAGTLAEGMIAAGLQVERPQMH